MNKSGLTLTELIVSSILIGIVILGIAAFTVAIKQIQETTGKSAPLTMRLAATLNHIKKNAYVAQGFKNNPGVRTNATDPEDPTCPRYFAFRHENDTTPTPGDYTDDHWIIYTDGDGLPDCDTFPPVLYACRQDESDYSGGNYSACDWDGGNPCTFQPDIQGVITTACEPTNQVMLVDTITNISYSFEPDTTAPDFYFDIEVTIVDDVSAAVDPINNPQHTLHNRISPISHTW